MIVPLKLLIVISFLCTLFGSVCTEENGKHDENSNGPTLSVKSEDDDASYCWKLNETRRNTLGVWFNPKVFPEAEKESSEYSENELEVMVELVSGKFTTIVLETLPIVSDYPSFEVDGVSSSELWIPKVVANFNKKWADKCQPRNVQVTLRVNEHLAALALQVSRITPFKLAKYVADSANNIYPGTVTTFMLTDDMFSKLEKSKADLVALKEQVSKGKHKYKLGITILDSSKCPQVVSDTTIHKALKLFDTFHVFSPNDDTGGSAETMTQIVIRNFAKCEKALKEIVPNAEMISVSSTLSNTKSPPSASKLTEFWKVMTTWATQTNRHIVAFQAFDSFVGETMVYEGWWMLNPQAQWKAEADLKTKHFLEKVTLKEL